MLLFRESWAARLEDLLRGEFSQYIRRTSIRYVVEHQQTCITIDYPDDSTEQFCITDSELRMSTTASEQWLCEVERRIRRKIESIRYRAYYHNLIIDRVGPGIRVGQNDEFDRQVDDLRHPSYIYNNFYYTSAKPAFSDDANRKAAELFVLAAGQAAYDTLKAGKPLPITGSLKTKYTLHNRAVYCIERVKDKAKLCAVVEDVPLWDHLLGIKLLVENDEPKFLQVANVSLFDMYYVDECPPLLRI